MGSKARKLGAALLLASCVSATAQSQTGGTAEASRGEAAAQSQAATKGLTTFQSLLQVGGKAGGFIAAEDAKRAQLGAPMRVYRIQLDAIRAMNASTPPASLLIDAQRSLFPVAVDGKIVSGLYTTRQNGQWVASEFGDGGLARNADAQRRDAGDFIVWVPAARVYFLGRGAGANLTLTALMDDPKHGYKAGQHLDAKQALLDLQQSLAGYNGLPR